MKCYDFDKTIYKKDSSTQLFLFALKRKPLLFFFVFKIGFYALLYAMRVISLERFKEKFFRFLNAFDDKKGLIEQFWDKEQKYINDWYKSEESGGLICSASPRFVIEPVLKRLHSDCIIYATEMDIDSLKIDGKNLKGADKKERLEKDGYVQFDAVYTDSLSDLPLLDMSTNKYLVVGGNVYEFGKQKIGFFGKIKFGIKEMRITHYVKNGLILLPIIFSGNLFNDGGKYLLQCLFGFISFSCVASMIYIFNDMVDVQKDRKHCKKRERPYASYMLNKLDMFVLLTGLFAILSVTWIFGLDMNMLAMYVLAGYFVLNILYSLVLKNLAIVDIFTIATCYVVRVYFGAIIVGVGVSKWLYLAIISISLYLGLGKRRGELVQAGDGETRKVNKKYSFDFLDKNMNMCLTMCVVFYSLWVVEFRVDFASHLNSILFLASIPMVIFILMKYSLNIERDKTSSDPVEVFLNDPVLILAVIVLVAVLLLAIYLPNATIR